MSLPELPGMTAIIWREPRTSDGGPIARGASNDQQDLGSERDSGWPQLSATITRDFEVPMGQLPLLIGSR